MKVTIVSILLLVSLAVVSHASTYCTYGGGSFGQHIQCFPSDPAMADSYCTQECSIEDGDNGWCPEYTDTELGQCRTQCFTAWGLQNCDDYCQPTWPHNCVLGLRP